MRFTCHVPGMTLYHGSARHWWEGITTEQAVGVARRLDELGYDYLTISEHLVLTPEMAEQYGPRWVHSLSAAGFVLGATTRIKVVVLVVVPYTAVSSWRRRWRRSISSPAVGSWCSR
jgi:alkanesulfonate monooxygenase SsuD/methylene tetrahydromethanopterin reductase-like flavin-dependent oxidoreductase (luciferase family)